MSTPVDKVFEIVSANGSTTYAPWFRVGGQLFNVHFQCPGAFGLIEIANDPYSPVTKASGLGNSMTAVTERPEWVRVGVASDASAPRNYLAHISVAKETN